MLLNGKKGLYNGRIFYKVVNNVWALMMLGNPKDLEDMYRGVTSLVIAWNLGFKCNLLLNGEIPIDDFANKHFDHVGYIIQAPLDSKLFTKNASPLVIIEDSTSSRRLSARMAELQSINIPKAFMHVVPKIQEYETILSLKKKDTMYEMEVNI